MAVTIASVSRMDWRSIDSIESSIGDCKPTRESTLGSNIAADHWAGDLGCGGGHEGGHLGGNHSCSHCERCVCVRERKDEASKE